MHPFNYSTHVPFTCSYLCTTPLHVQYILQSYHGNRVYNHLTWNICIHHPQPFHGSCNVRITYTTQPYTMCLFWINVYSYLGETQPKNVLYLVFSWMVKQAQGSLHSSTTFWEQRWLLKVTHAGKKQPQYLSYNTYSKYSCRSPSCPVQHIRNRWQTCKDRQTYMHANPEADLVKEDQPCHFLLSMNERRIKQNHIDTMRAYHEAIVNWKNAIVALTFPHKTKATRTQHNS